MMVNGTLAEKGFPAFNEADLKIPEERKTPHIWVIVADREQVYVYSKTAEGLKSIAHARARGKHTKTVDDHIFNPETMVSQSHLNPRYKRSYHEDISFIRKLVEWLDGAERESSFDRLILVAAPYTLGNIRACLTKALQRRVIDTVNKELTKLPAMELQRHLEKKQTITIF